MYIDNKRVFLGLTIAIFLGTTNRIHSEQEETTWKEIAGYCAIILSSAGMGALSGYYDAVCLGSKYNAMIEDLNKISFSREIFEKEISNVFQGSIISHGNFLAISSFQWFVSWYARRSLINGVRQNSQRSWIKQSIGGVSLAAAWLSWAITYSLFYKKPAILNLENFKNWNK